MTRARDRRALRRDRRLRGGRALPGHAAQALLDRDGAAARVRGRGARRAARSSSSTRCSRSATPSSSSDASARCPRSGAAAGPSSSSATTSAPSSSCARGRCGSTTGASVRTGRRARSSPSTCGRGIAGSTHVEFGDEDEGPVALTLGVAPRRDAATDRAAATRRRVHRPPALHDESPAAGSRRRRVPRGPARGPGARRGVVGHRSPSDHGRRDRGRSRSICRLAPGLAPGPYTLGVWMGSAIAEGEDHVHRDAMTLTVAPAVGDRADAVQRSRIVAPNVAWDMRAVTSGPSSPDRESDGRVDLARPLSADRRRCRRAPSISSSHMAPRSSVSSSCDGPLEPRALSSRASSDRLGDRVREHLLRVALRRAPARPRDGGPRIGRDGRRSRRGEVRDDAARAGRRGRGASLPGAGEFSSLVRRGGRDSPPASWPACSSGPPPLGRAHRRTRRRPTRPGSTGLRAEARDSLLAASPGSRRRRRRPALDLGAARVLRRCRSPTGDLDRPSASRSCWQRRRTSSSGASSSRSERASAGARAAGAVLHACPRTGFASSTTRLVRVLADVSSAPVRSRAGGVG